MVLASMEDKTVGLLRFYQDLGLKMTHSRIPCSKMDRWALCDGQGSQAHLVGIVASNIHRSANADDAQARRAIAAKIRLMPSLLPNCELRIRCTLFTVPATRAVQWSIKHQDTARLYFETGRMMLDYLTLTYVT